MNALVEPSVIDALYRASQGGVAIELVVRGICCLRPGLPGVSETIRVTSIVDKFLEHSRIFYFENGGNPAVFLASADWMPRNFWRRIETLFPIEDASLQARIVGDIIQPILGDTVKVRELCSDGAYRRRSPADGEAPLRSQIALQHLAREAARESTDVRPPWVPIVRRPVPRTPHGEPAPV
jgi:polyphosphate kinase